MRTSVVFSLLFGLFLGLFWNMPVFADSLRLLTDLEYDFSDTEITNKVTDETLKSERTTFSQLYSLDVQKELMPNLNLNFGGLFDQDKSRGKTEGEERRKSRDESVRPYIDLQLNSPLVRAMLGYRKSQISQRTNSGSGTNRSFTKEYSASLNWEPVELPEVDLDFTRTLNYNRPKTNDQRVDSYHLRSRYAYENFRFTFNHSTSEARNEITDFETTSNTDSGSVRFNRSYQQERVSLNSSLKASRQEVKFSGEGDRLVPTASPGTIIGRPEDSFPLNSDPETGFSLNQVDLLVDSAAEAQPFSFGLDFGELVDVDTLLVVLDDLMNYSSGQFVWSVYVRDNETDSWTQLAAVQDETNIAEQQYELSFTSVETRYIKIVTTPLAPPEVPSGEDLLITDVIARRTLPPETSTFESFDWTGNAVVNWRHSDKTSTGYDFLYREQESKTIDEKKTRLNLGARLSHRFNEVFSGNMRLQRSASKDRDTRTNYSYSAALSARYFATFDQSLTYSYSRQLENGSRSSTSNAIFLRNNLRLYEGWSMYLDNGYSWQTPASGRETSTTFAQISTNIVPNRWLNMTLSYGTSWRRQPDRAVVRDQNGRIVVTWVPTSSLSLSANISYNDEGLTDEGSDVQQRYSVNWSPFRDGTLRFSMAYSQTENNDDETFWTLSPALRWQINRKTLLTLEYAKGEREDPEELAEFENISLGLRFFY